MKRDWTRRESNQRCAKRSTRHQPCNGEYIDFDRELSTKQSILTDKYIIQEVLGNSADITSDEDDMKVRELESIRKPLIEEVRTDIEMLEKRSLYSKFEEVVMKSFRRVNHYVSP